MIKFFLQNVKTKKYQKSIFLQCNDKNVDFLMNIGDKGSVQMEGGLCFINNRVTTLLTQTLKAFGFSSS